MTAKPWAYTLVYNEATLIAYWVRHYVSFCDRVIVYVDDATNDGTEEIAEREGAEVRTYYGTGHLDDIAFVRFAEERYKEARGKTDWVIWTDADEILYHPRITERLSEIRASGVNFPDVLGYNMFSENPPTTDGQIYTEIQRGVQSDAYAKRCIFDPVLDVVWSTGKHNAYVAGPVHTDNTVSDDPLKLLHYRWLGKEWFLARNARNFSRLNAVNISRQHGRETYPGYEGIYSAAWYAEQAALAKACI